MGENYTVASPSISLVRMAVSLSMLSTQFHKIHPVIYISYVNTVKPVMQLQDMFDSGSFVSTVCFNYNQMRRV